MRTPRQAHFPRFTARVAGAAATGALVLAVLTLTGCAAAGPAAQPTASASATPTPDIAVQPVVLAAPAQVLDGDCSALFSEAELSALLGADVSERAGFLDTPSANAVPAVGGIACTWAEAVPTTGAALSVVVVSTTAVPAAADDTTCYESSVDTSGELASACSFGVTAGPLWLSGVVYTAAGTGEEDTRAVVTAVSDIFGAIEATAPASEAPVTAWPTSDCAALSEAADVATVLQSPDLVVSAAESGGGERPAGILAAATAAGVFDCSWYQNGEIPVGQLSGFNLQALPGGAWAQAQVLALPGAETVLLPGVQLAVRVPMEEATTGVAEVMNVFDGVNWLQVSGPEQLDAVAPAVTALVATLNGG
jgi:hypothetical protein